MVKGRRDRKQPQRVVGVGASAGGLDALMRLVARIPIDSGLAFVVLQHLPPSQRGALASRLASATSLPVIDVETGHRVEPDTILVVPPHTAARLYRGALVLRTSGDGERPRMPIDSLFRSLADVLHERAVGVVLSGTANDGTAGLRAIQAAGGLTFAQEPATAQFDEMPRTAIAAGVAEIVASPAEIGDELGAIARPIPTPAGDHTVGTTPAIERVLEQLREASGIDFTSYKRSTIERRLARRLAKHHLASLADYSAYLVVHPGEASAVYEDLLIHVTEFFRDAPVLDRVIDLVCADARAQPADTPVRVWVPGCSTGEEVYSIAILLRERLGEHRQIQLFGSDLSEHAIEAARRGYYRDSIATQVGPERLAAYFRRESGGYRIRAEIRERCVFARHDVVTDPPFSKLNLVSCRNVLIYLGASLQQRVIPQFHYALAQPGYLLLGRAETIGNFEMLFSTVDADARIYARKPSGSASLTFPHVGQVIRLPWRRAVDADRSRLDVQRDVDHVLLARYAPPCVVVDDELDVVQFRGRTGPYLEAPPGQPQLNLLRMARDGLASVLPLAINKARRNDAPVRHEHLVVRDHGQAHAFNLEVVPLRNSDAKRHFLVLFEPAVPTARRTPAAGKPARADRGELNRVREELAGAREYLRTVTAQHLATSEELGVANEELQSTNEEAQASNEELQTAKEELQSTNEELETVNDELHRGNAQLREANDDLVNVLASVDIAIIIVDATRCVRRFTPKARSVMKLIPGDIGRPIADLQLRVVAPELDAEIAQVIETLAVYDAEVRDAQGMSYRMQIRPYYTADHAISGAVIAFVDITALRAARDHATAIVEAVPAPLVVLDARLRIRSANAAFFATFDVSSHDAIGRALLDLGVWSDPGLRERLEAVLASGAGFDDVDVEHRGTAGSRMLVLGARAFPPANGEQSILVGIADVTEGRRLEREREAAQRERDTFLDAVSHELRTPLSAIMLWAQALQGIGHDDPRRVFALDTIIDAAQTEARIVDDLLDLAISRSRQLTVKLESADPAAIVLAAVDAARADASAKHLVLETELAPGRMILVDPRRLSQIATKLISNAIKFTPAGGEVSVSLAMRDAMMELQVRDNGAGIAAESLPHVFDPFGADRASTRSHAGLGIGLALVRHLVERHDGTIQVLSPGEGLGTTFVVRIPTSPTSS
jgi:two-component system CheB/CheR fusion protein